MGLSNKKIQKTNRKMSINEIHQEFLVLACKESQQAVIEGNNPFGAVIVNENGEIVVASHNKISTYCDPSAHAEVTAIRQACQKLRNTSLKGCTLYSSCEPCPMCLTCAYWADISQIYFSCTRNDADRIGFGDKIFYQELEKPMSERIIPLTQINVKDQIKGMEMYQEKKNDSIHDDQ